MRGREALLFRNFLAFWTIVLCCAALVRTKQRRRQDSTAKLLHCNSIIGECDSNPSMLPLLPLVSRVAWLSPKRNNWANPNSFFPFSELKCHVSVLKWPGDQNRSNMWIRMVFRMVFSVQHDSNNRAGLRPFLCINDKIYRPSPRQASSQTPHTTVPIFPIP